MLEEASSLLKQKKEIETKQRLLGAFNGHYLLTDDQAITLTSAAEPVDDEFFRLLRRTKKIHNDCQVLLGTEDQRLGIEILEQSSKRLDAAFQKLYRWIQREIKTLDLENPQISSSIRRALRVLAERPTLFQNCLDSFAEARERTLSDAFYTALTGSISDSTNHVSTKPIEFQAHDPLRYVGDMLAWAHSATVSEREALEVLFISEGDEMAKGIQAGLESDPWSRPEDGKEEIFDGRKALSQLVSRDLTGVARLLRQRTEQLIRSHVNATLAYRIANLLGFYKNMFTKLIGEEADVVDVLAGLEESALRQFRANMQDHVAAVQSELAVAPPDLSPPEFLEEALDMLKDLLKSYETSVTSSDSMGQGFRPVLAEALDPFLNGCENLWKRLPAPDGDVFAINCLAAARAVLLPFSFTREKVSNIEDNIEEHTTNLVEQQHRFFIHHSGLQPLLAALAPLSKSQGVVASIPSLKAFQPEPLVATSQTLDDFLPSALIDAMENIKRLRDTKMAQEITEEAADKFCDDFEYVESMIVAADEMRAVEDGEEEGPVPSLRELFPRTGAEIRVLLS
ncbi:oligomeric Golgi complex subunit 6 [Coniosporium apollinis CBS 100218]|uniref:Conserved oligomeric Golgi complex subunit 6 n=1 Tax=Coniosporium apollinis (strain CBS 100218) TaxID=1168221 RepID=R7YPN3_CONA1|nr:oligomeric Golgi complex subunit 6 [Coniosporium apollinis CBS 100218]EON63862.1 oligomeric Golgi complex subunit 6 [Coniosporium apollinis CBS 100218]